jgi:AraC-like DNA-binding protein
VVGRREQMSDSYSLIFEQYRVVDNDNRPVDHSFAQTPRWLELPGCLFQNNNFRLPADLRSSAVVKAGLYISVILSGDGSGGPSDGSAHISYTENMLTVMALREPTACDGFAPRGALMQAASLAFPLETIERFGLSREFLNLFETGGQGMVFVSLKAHPRLQAIALEMLKPSVDGRPGELLLSAQALELLARTIFALQQRVEVRAATNPVQSRLQSTKDLIDSDLRHPWSIAELARHAGLSRRSFHQHFSAAYGTSPADYLRTRRLEVAREALIYRDMSVTEAAYSVGYASPANFATAFRRQFGVPPSACRRQKAV